MCAERAPRLPKSRESVTQSIRACSVLIALACQLALSVAAHAQTVAARALWPISIDNPESGSIFPPGITAPTLLWRDAAGTSWGIEINFSGKAAPIRGTTAGEHYRLGALDPECELNPNDQPKLTPRQAATFTWTPDRAIWAAIQEH